MAAQGDEDTDMRRSSRDVADELRSQIEAGKYAVGDKLPSYRDLAVQTGVSVNTAMKAVGHLVADGLVDHQPNGASRVRDPREHLDAAQEIRALRAELVELREKVRTATDDLSQVGQRLSAIGARLGSLES